jgi:hypothetical protein
VRFPVAGFAPEAVGVPVGVNLGVAVARYQDESGVIGHLIISGML